MRATIVALALLLSAHMASAEVSSDLVELSHQIQQLAATRAEESESARLARFFALYWDIRLREFPDLAFWVGYPGLGDRWPERSPETLALMRRITRDEPQSRPWYSSARGSRWGSRRRG